MNNISLRVLPAILPIDGKSAEFQATDTYIQWRIVGDVTWIDLVALADITGPAGPSIELRSNGSFLQWRQEGDVAWIDLISIAAITGPQGAAATVQVGTTTTLSAGSSATVVNAGTNQAALLNFGIPQGAVGQGVPTGGATGQVLAKTSNTNYATAWVDSAAALPTRYWQGYQHVNNVSTPNTKIDIGAGSSRDSTDAINIVNVAGTIDCATVGANGLDAGALANNTWYYTFAITTAAGVTAYVASTSPTAPTLPATYTKFRRVGSFKTNGSAQILGFTHVNDQWWWASSPRDVNTPTLGTTRTLFPLSVPRVIGVTAKYAATIINAAAVSVSIYPGFLGAGAANGTVGYNGTGGVSTGETQVDAAGQIYAVSTAASTTLVIDSAGWKDVL